MKSMEWAERWSPSRQGHKKRECPVAETNPSTRHHNSASVTPAREHLNLMRTITSSRTRPTRRRSSSAGRMGVLTQEPILMPVPLNANTQHVPSDALGLLFCWPYNPK